MNHFFVKSLLFASLVFSASALCWAVVRLILSILNKKGNKNCLVWYSLLFVLATWCLRYSVGYYSIFYPNEYITSGLTEFEEIFNSVIHTLQSFSIDEKYTEYIAAGKEMIKLVYGENSRCVTAYGIYASVLNMLAPICGGAILLDILQGVFPGAKLFFKTLAWWKNKYYFSELNESSLACAKSIISQKRRLFNKPVIVFTDVYTDGENEKSSELLKKAKALGAICMNDDITRFSNRFISKKEFWLIDENEIENIKTLAELTSDEHYKRIKKVIIRIFYHDDSYALTESGIAKQVKEKYENLISYEFRKRKIPTVIRLRITELSLLFKNTDGIMKWQGEYTVFGGQQLSVRINLTSETKVFDSVLVMPVTSNISRTMKNVANAVGTKSKKDEINQLMLSKRSFAISGKKWSVRSRKIIYIQSKTAGFTDYGEITDVAKHEFGHALGLGDLYYSTEDNLPGVEKGTFWELDSFYVNNKIYNLVMCDHSGPVSNNDIEMIVLAFSENKAQLYQKSNLKDEISFALGRGN